MYYICNSAAKHIFLFSAVIHTVVQDDDDDDNRPRINGRISVFVLIKN